MKSKLLPVGENTQIQVDEDTQYVLWFEDLSPGKRYSLGLTFEKEGAHAEIIAPYKLGKGEHLDLTTIATHNAPHTTCNTAVRGVLQDDSSSMYVGKIIINKKAQQTNSYLDDKVLMVGENAKNTSKPVLEIEADDVKASHGATTGKISPEQIYYLQTRGLSEGEAEKLIVEGFFGSLLSKVKDEKIRHKVKVKINV